MKKTD